MNVAPSHTSMRWTWSSRSASGALSAPSWRACFEPEDHPPGRQRHCQEEPDDRARGSAGACACRGVHGAPASTAAATSASTAPSSSVSSSCAMRQEADFEGRRRQIDAAPRAPRERIARTTRACAAGMAIDAAHRRGTSVACSQKIDACWTTSRPTSRARKSRAQMRRRTRRPLARARASRRAAPSCSASRGRRACRPDSR